MHVVGKCEINKKYVVLLYTMWGYFKYLNVGAGKNYSRLNHVLLEIDIYGKLVEHRQLGTKHSNL